MAYNRIVEYSYGVGSATHILSRGEVISILALFSLYCIWLSLNKTIPLYTAINYWNTYFTFYIKTIYFFYPLSKTLFLNGVKKRIIKRYNPSQRLTQNTLLLLKSPFSENKNIIYRHIGVVSIFLLHSSTTIWNKIFFYWKNKYLLSWQNRMREKRFLKIYYLYSWF